jgi:hypothetical protein
MVSEDVAFFPVGDCVDKHGGGGAHVPENLREIIEEKIETWRAPPQGTPVRIHRRSPLRGTPAPGGSARGNGAGSSSLMDNFKRYLEGSGRGASLFAGAVLGGSHWGIHKGYRKGGPGGGYHWDL